MSHFSDIGAAVIGSGFIGTVHIEALRRLGVRVHGLLGSSPERGEEAAARIGVPRAYPSLEALLDDPEVDVVHVTSPNQLHYPQVKAILAAGRHVICEKPLATTSEESAELVRLADASDRITAVNFNIRFYPLNQHAHRMVEDGALGEPRLVTGHYFQDWLLRDTDWNWRLEPDKGGSLRAVGDIGSHWIDLTSFISGLRVTQVMADLATFVTVRQRPDRPGRDVLPGASERHRPDPDVDRGRRPHPPALRGWRARLGGHQPGQRRPQELAPVGGRRLRIGRMVGLRDARPPVHRATAGGPNEILQRGAELMNRDRHRRDEPAGRPRRGLRGHVPRALPRGLRCGPGRAAAPSTCTTPPSWTATTRCSSAMPSRRSAREGRWVDVAGSADDERGETT